MVGAGGGGFPTHVKLGGKADTVIANGAECEPLLHKDAVVMEHQGAQIVGKQREKRLVGTRRAAVMQFDFAKVKIAHVCDHVVALGTGNACRQGRG